MKQQCMYHLILCIFLWRPWHICIPPPLPSPPFQKLYFLCHFSHTFHRLEQMYWNPSLSMLRIPNVCRKQNLNWTGASYLFIFKILLTDFSLPLAANAPSPLVLGHSMVRQSLARESYRKWLENCFRSQWRKRKRNHKIQPRKKL